MTISFRAVILLAVVCVSTGNTNARDPNAQELALRQEATLQRINSLKLNYQQVIHGLETEDSVRKGTYLRKGPVVFVKEISGSPKLTWVQSNVRRDLQTVRSLQQSVRANQPMIYQADIYRADASLGTTDLYSPLLFQAFDPNESRIVSYQERYSKCKTSVHEVTLNGRPSYRVDAEQNVKGNSTVESYWHDPNYGYLVVKLSKSKSGFFSSPYQVVELTDWSIVNECDFPNRMLLTQYVNGKVDYTHTIECGDIEINRKIDDKLLELPVMTRTGFCYDHVRNKQYQIDSTWKSVGKEADFVVQKYEAKQSSIDAAKPFDFEPSKDLKPFPWYWLVMLSAILLVSALIWKYVKSKREQNESSH